jgi:tetratricopeptide (TPR) repeat protein
MRAFVLVLIALYGACALAQNSSNSSSNSSSPPSTPSTTNAPQGPTPSNPQSQDSGSSQGASSSSDSKPAQTGNSQSEMPRSERVNASSLEPGESSSKDSQIDLSPPADDAKAHPNSSDELVDEGSGTANASEFRYWDPHRAAKDVEVGDFYFKRRNYKAAVDRYREALLYKANDAVATFRLAQCLDKMEEPDQARAEYEAYLKILPNGPESEHARKAIARLKPPAKQDPR